MTKEHGCLMWTCCRMARQHRCNAGFVGLYSRSNSLREIFVNSSLIVSLNIEYSMVFMIDQVYSSKFPVKDTPREIVNLHVNRPFNRATF